MSSKSSRTHSYHDISNIESSAGSRDSSLSTHGVLQTRRLGSHIASRRDVIGPVSHVFTSNLQRAYRTAEAIANAQRRWPSNSDKTDVIPKVVQLAELREKDFGSAEGVKFAAKAVGRANGSIASDSETRDAMLVRVNRFITNHLRSVLESHVSEKTTVAIVAHGLILGSLLQALKTRLPDNTVSAYGPKAAWSNTGVLQVKISSAQLVHGADTVLSQAEGDAVKVGLPLRSCLTMTVQCINNIDHLKGLKKSRGSAKLDSRQRPVTAFFTLLPKAAGPKKISLDNHHNSHDPTG